MKQRQMLDTLLFDCQYSGGEKNIHSSDLDCKEREHFLGRRIMAIFLRDTVESPGLGDRLWPEFLGIFSLL
jgi:hypothetical protein